MWVRPTRGSFRSLALAGLAGLLALGSVACADGGEVEEEVEEQVTEERT